MDSTIPWLPDFYAFAVIMLQMKMGHRELSQSQVANYLNELHARRGNSIGVVDTLIKLFLSVSEQHRLHHTVQEINDYIVKNTKYVKNMLFFKQNYAKNEYTFNKFRTYENQMELARSFLDFGLYEKCIQNYQEALNKAQSDKQKAQTSFEFGYLYYFTGNSSNALNYYQQAVNFYEKENLYHSEIPPILNNIGMCLANGGHFKESIPVYKRALKILERQEGGINDIMTGKVYENLANCELKFKDFQEAEKHYKVVLEIKQNYFGSDHLQTAETLQNISVLLKEMKKYDQSLQFLKKSYAIKERIFGKNSDDLNEILCLFGQIYIKLQRQQEGINCLWKLVSIQEKKAGGAQKGELNKIFQFLIETFKEENMNSEIVKVLNKQLEVANLNGDTSQANKCQKQLQYYKKLF